LSRLRRALREANRITTSAQAISLQEKAALQLSLFAFCGLCRVAFAIVIPPPHATRLSARLVNDVERRLRRSPKMREAGRRHHSANLRFTGLRSEAQPDFLRSRAWRTQQRRER